MRIKEEWKKSGYFWLPSQDDKKIPGTLTILDGGRIELEILGLFDEKRDFFNESDDLERIIGFVEKDGLVTLEDCFYRTKNISFGCISKSVVHVAQVISGVAYDKYEKVKFNTVTFSIEGLNEWVSITGINISRSRDFRTATISYTPQDELIYNLISGLKLHIIFGYTLPGTTSVGEAKISHQTYFKLSSEVPREFNEFSSIIHQITKLLCFAIDSTVSITNVSATSNEILREVSAGVNKPVNLKLYYESLPYSENIPKISTHRMLFRFSDIRENAESVLNKWLCTYSMISPSLGLYFSAVSDEKKYLDGRFLALAQSLETYHRRTSDETERDETEFRSMVASLLWKCPKQNRRWLHGRLRYGNEINLGQRIKRIIEPYKSYLGNSKQRSKFIKNVVTTRNYLTHYSLELEKEASNGTELWMLCRKMEAVFQLHLLQQLGFREAEIKRVLSNNYKLKQKFE